MTAQPRESPSIKLRSDEGAQVIAFRPRTSEHPPVPQPGPVRAGMDDRARAESDASDGDDFRHRMLTNLAAFLFLAGLTGAGIWLAASISDLRRTQDCVLANRPNCAQIVTPAR